MFDLPAWANDIIEARARAMGVDRDEALLMSLDLKPTDPLAQSAGWAVHAGSPVRSVARRMHYSRSSIEQAARRFGPRR